MSAVAQLRAEIQEHQQQGRYAPKTIEAYRYDWDLFVKACSRLERAALPASSDTVLLFIADAFQRGQRASSVRRRASAVAYRHQQQGYPSPVSAECHELIAGVKRARREIPRQKRALTVDQLRAIARRLTQDGSTRAIRNRAILVCGFASALRRSSIVALELADVEFVDEGAVLKIRGEKNDTRAKGRLIGLPFGKHAETCPIRCLRAWLELRPANGARLFTRVDDRGRGLPMRPAHVASILQRAVKSLGLDAREYGAHSLRAGLVTAGSEHGASELLIAAQTGHRSLEVLKQYFRRTELFRANVAGMVGL
jgi:site-specific recombinase XerD